jgi:hypothetical protein
MSLAGDRQAIADALSSLDDVTGYKYRPTIIRPGDAWPLIEFLDNPGAYNLMATWRVIVVLPAGEQDAMEFFDSMHEEVSDVLNEQFGVVERIEPGNLSTEAGTMNVMILTVTREA